MECRLCGGEASELILSGRKHGDCPECGYLGVDESLFPEPDAERRRYTLHNNDPGEPGYRAYLGTFIDAALKPFLPDGARILDFGSGPVPALGAILGQQGYRVRSWDPFFSPESSWEEEEWDAVILHEVAEHLHRPAQTFRKIASHIAPDGIIALRTRFRPGTRAELESWWYRSDMTHVGFYSPRSFAVLAARIGFSLALCAAPDMAVLKQYRA